MAQQEPHPSKAYASRIKLFQFRRGPSDPTYDARFLIEDKWTGWIRMGGVVTRDEAIFASIERLHALKADAKAGIKTTRVLRRHTGHDLGRKPLLVVAEPRTGLRDLCRQPMCGALDSRCQVRHGRLGVVQTVLQDQRPDIFMTERIRSVITAGSTDSR